MSLVNRSFLSVVRGPKLHWGKSGGRHLAPQSPEFGAVQALTSIGAVDPPPLGGNSTMEVRA